MIHYPALWHAPLSLYNYPPVTLWPTLQTQSHITAILIVNFSKLAAQINEQYKSFYIQTSHPPTYTCPRCVSEKGSGPHFKHYRCRKREKIPLLLWDPQSRPYLLTRALKWNKSAIKKRALAIETLLMQQAERGSPGVMWQWSTTVPL